MGLTKRPELSSGAREADQGGRRRLPPRRHRRRLRPAGRRWPCALYIGTATMSKIYIKGNSKKARLPVPPHLPCQCSL